jgi:hypothetical protein
VKRLARGEINHLHRATAPMVDTVPLLPGPLHVTTAPIIDAMLLLPGLLRRRCSGSRACPVAIIACNLEPREHVSSCAAGAHLRVRSRRQHLIPPPPALLPWSRHHTRTKAACIRTGIEHGLLRPPPQQRSPSARGATKSKCALLDYGCHAWSPNRAQMSYPARQTGQAVSHWLW